MTNSSILSYLYPQHIEARSSKFNHQIKVYQFLGKYFISVDNFTQSGGLVTKIWQKVISYISAHQFKNSYPKKILILGLGAGNSIKHITQKWPQSQLMAIEIDSVMIELAKKFNHLDQIEQLTIVKQDVFTWIKKNRNKYDLILIDLFIGKKMPKQSESVSFLQTVLSHLQENGVVVINRATQKEHKKANQTFQQNLKKVFPSVERIKTPVNSVFAATKQ